MTEPLVQEPKLQTTPEELSSRITAHAPLNTVLIDITVRDTEPERAARIAHAVAERFSTPVERLQAPTRPASVEGTGPQMHDWATEPPPGSPVCPGVTQEAVAPSTWACLRPLLNAAAGVLAGLLLGAGLVVLRRTPDTTLKTSKAPGEATSLPGLDTIPYDRNAVEHPLVGVDGHSRRAEALRELRTHVQFSQVGDRPRIIVVTRSVPAEGRTNTAVHPALSLAAAGVSTCPVDADLRPACVAAAFGLVQDAGLTTVLIGQACIEEVMRETGGGLPVLAGGPVPPTPTELLASARRDEVLREPARVHEVVIVGTALLLPVADTAGLASLAHSTLLVVRAARTRRDQTRSLGESPDRLGVRVLGTLFSMAAVRKGESYGACTGHGDLPAPRASAATKEAAGPTVTRRVGEQ